MPGTKNNLATEAAFSGHDFGGEIKIVAGLKADDRVVLNPPDSLASGQQVNIVQASLPGDAQ